jgi:hypothetical protein
LKSGSAGTSGQILASTGSATAPAWTNNITVNTISLLNSLSTNSSYSGVVETITVGENVSFGDVLYLKFLDGK